MYQTYTYSSLPKDIYIGLILILVSTYNYSDLPKDIYLNFCQTDTYPHTRTYIFLKSPVGVHRTYAYMEIPLGTTKLILILRSLNLFGGTRRYYGDITDHIQILRNLPLYWSTRKYCKTYTGTSYIILVLRSISWSYGTYTCITEFILVFQILSWYYSTYTCISDLIHVLQNLYLSYGSYSYAKVPVGTMSQNISGSYHIEGQIRLLQIRRLFVRRHRSQIHYMEITLVTTGLISNLQNLYLFYRYKSTRRYYRTYTYLTDTGVTLGTTGLILVLPIREYP